MKKIIAMLLSVLTVLCVVWIPCAGVSAETDYTSALNEALQENAKDGFGKGYTVGESVVNYRLGDIDRPNLTFAKMMSQSQHRMAVLLKDGKPVGEVGFFHQNGSWVFGGAREYGSLLQDTIDRYGTDWIYISRYDTMQVVLPEEPNMTFDMEGNGTYALSAKETDFRHATMTLADYVACASYYNAQPKEPGVLMGGGEEFNADTLAAAKQYWAEHPQNNFAYGWVIAAVLVVAGAAVAFVCYRRKNVNKQHKN